MVFLVFSSFIIKLYNKHHLTINVMLINCYQTCSSKCSVCKKFQVSVKFAKYLSLNSFDDSLHEITIHVKICEILNTSICVLVKLKPFSTAYWIPAIKQQQWIKPPSLPSQPVLSLFFCKFKMTTLPCELLNASNWCIESMVHTYIFVLSS